MSIIKTIPPPPKCFSCKNELPEKDYDLFHQLVEQYKSSITQPLSEEAAWKVILDGKLSKVYHKRCCRTMFIGDAIEYRRDAALYDLSKVNENVTF